MRGAAGVKAAMWRALVICWPGVLLSASPALAAPGDLDPEFSNDGKLISDLGWGAADVVARDSGESVVLGTDNLGQDFLLLGYTDHGKLDPSFGESGVVSTDFDGRLDDGRALALDAEGRLVAAGVSYVGRIAVARYQPDGELDPSFGLAGRAVVDLGGSVEVSDMAIQADGSIVVVGYRWDTGGQADFLVLRLTDQGSLDGTFSADGWLTADFAGGWDEATGLALSGDGDLVVAGSAGSAGPGSDDDVAVARFEPDGSPDPSFSGDGEATIARATRERGLAVAMQPDGRIIVGGLGFEEPSSPAPWHMLFARLTAGGELDPSFGDGGVSLVGSSTGPDVVNSLTVLADGRILGAGGFVHGRDQDFGLARLQADGELDESFGDGGLVATEFDRIDSDEEAVALDFDPQGRIVVAGSLLPRQPGAIALARYLDVAGPADADADGVRDRRDECRLRFGKTSSGCHRFARRLSSHYSGEGQELSGRIDSHAKRCERRRPVTLFATRSGPDRAIARTSSHKDGSWSLSAHDAGGRVYALARRSLHRNLGICVRARSDAVQARNHG
jgi:uncharacterized delta-60 repeat protein